MVEVRTTIHLDSELMEKLEEWCERNNKTKKEAFNLAVKLLLDLKPHGVEVEAIRVEDVKEIQLKQIIFKYHQRCYTHKDVFGKDYTIQPGEIGFWGKGVAVCYRCYIKLNEHQLEDAKKLVRLYKEIQKLSILKRELKKEVDKYAREASIWELLTRIEDYYRKVDQRLASLSIYNPNSEEVKQLTVEIRELGRKIMRELNLSKPMLKQYAKDLTKRDRW